MKPIQRMTGILFAIQRRDYDAGGMYKAAILETWDMAIEQYDRETLKHEFMPVLQQVWKETSEPARR